MAAQMKKTTIHGVEVSQVNYSGKWYTPVAGRVQIAEQADPTTIRRKGHGYHVVSVQIIQIGDQWAYHCMVEYPVGSGVIRPGTDFIDLGDKKSGIAKAETSAIGRALGLHGIAIEEGIASAEEMSRVQNDAPHSTPAANLTAHTKHTTPTPSATPAASSAQPAPSTDPMALTHASGIDQKRLYGQLAARWPAVDAQSGFLRNVTGRSIDADKLRDGRSDISLDELLRANERLTHMPAPAQANGKAATK